MVFVLPMLIGARDLAFPRLNAFTYWTFLASGLFLLASFFWGQAPNAGWFAYTPFSDRMYSPSMGLDFYALALVFFTISSTGGAINFIVTIFRHRAPGMHITKMPVALYSTLTSSIVSIACSSHTAGAARFPGRCSFRTGRSRTSCHSCRRSGSCFL